MNYSHYYDTIDTMDSRAISRVDAGFNMEMILWPLPIRVHVLWVFTEMLAVLEPTKQFISSTPGEKPQVRSLSPRVRKVTAHDLYKEPKSHCFHVGY